MFNTGLLRTKVARRLLLLFVTCALLPITALALVSYGHVTRQLSQQSEGRLRQASKSTGLAMLQRLLLLQTQMQLVLPELRRTRGELDLDRVLRDYSTGFKKLSVAAPPGKAALVVGSGQDVPTLSEAEREHLQSDQALLLTAPADSGEPPRVLMGRQLDPNDESRGILWGEVAHSYLWGSLADLELPPNTSLCVLLQDHTPLFCSDGLAPRELLAGLDTRPSSAFEWRANGQDFFAASWSLFLRREFAAADWAFVLSEPRAVVMAPMAEFKTSFILIILLSLLVVMLLSNVQIRRSMEPLVQLKEATLRIAQRQFRTEVQVSSGDEFEELAGSFNSMSVRLEQQFHALATANEIDRAILTALDRGGVIETVLQRAPEVIPSEAIAIMALDEESGRATTYCATRAENGRSLHSELNLSAEDARALRFHSNGARFDRTEDFPEYLQPASAAFSAISCWNVFPVFLRTRLAGALAFGSTRSVELTEDDRTRARHLTDQIAVGLSTADLIAELDSLNLGALTALARVIDAKSPWTAGHSERVTMVALGIGRQLGLPKSELETLRRGALLHDIGKIGIPLDILDKPGRLTPEETATMQQHVRIGARILEPIPNYSGVIPIVLHHHERFDGLGYPDRLAGEAIHPHARILAVADNFDALSSERPYRPGLERAVCVEMIERGRGRDFDPVMVDALLAYLAAQPDDGLIEEPERYAVGAA